MTGAPALAAMAALKSGSGLVTAAVPDRCLESVAAHNPCLMTVPVADDENGCMTADALSVLSDLSTQATSIGIGPGLSLTDGTAQVVCDLFQTFSRPMVMDADALNALAAHDDFPSTSQPRILTPHIGEFRRLVRQPDWTVEQCRQHARTFAAEHKVILVLKGPNTIVTDGTTEYQNTTGNPGMATGGAGDVLTGMITAFCSQAFTPLEAAVLGVYLHGIAGDCARDDVGEVSLTALDIVRHLPTAIQKHVGA